ncbi:aminotransferase class V-fold PLP-dependent enzyme [Marinilongibacter aquaticus]|uniref:aminotransferase class V-fold PLP-dependent enzyme n=1 Tax=Marinilongibacter aquaticus TaxID=2975157 RepID=UPI0021BDD5B7|nr:aminotransferase class V-fold PLP-dependent enzyme [Marinilongibacter aquaticus]UBM59948.1 aminotransferase class V-fold PLP-dependent enzyme [Marinilongibacter aquaticus]
MLNFYPGPSKLQAEVGEYMQDALASGILERNHRSPAFEELLAETVKNVKEKLDVPEDYRVYFTSSATECWEITAQSLLQGRIQFLYNGAFGKKWFKYTVTNPELDKSERKTQIRGSRFTLDQPLSEAEIDQQADCLCTTQCETSNGTAIAMEELAKLPGKALKCIDATSSMAGQYLDFRLADVWFASVQKAFGLPAGMGILICSPKALAQAEQINERNHYNSLLFIDENFRKNQTHYTPNVLEIYLMNALLKNRAPISEIDKKAKRRAEHIYKFITAHEKLENLVQNPLTRAQTVLAIASEKQVIESTKRKAEEKGIILGNGYGEWKENTFRIANFPAIPDTDFDQLIQFLQEI